jgi:prepilin-type N-terminal cleavage/methylation domain-containing protein
MDKRSRIHGFTLIEVLIAVGLGSVLCYVAYAAMRVGSASVTTVNRLSLENQLMRAGVIAALDELDFWTTYDNPDDPTQQPLRGSSPCGAGLAFHPLAFTASDRNLRFDPSHPRSWFRGNPATCNNHGFGDHSLFSRDGHPDIDHRWQATMLKDIAWTLGFYGLNEYMPANTLFSYYAADGGTPFEMSYQFQNAPKLHQYYYVVSSLNHGWAPRDRQNTTNDCFFPVTTDPTYIANDYQRRHFWMITDAGPLYYWYDYSRYQPDLWGGDHNALDKTSSQPAWLAVTPTHWPELDLRVSHFAAMSRSLHTAKILLRDPVSAKQTKLFFKATCTTLRGARQQRRQGGGWIDLSDRSQRNLDAL